MIFGGWGTLVLQFQSQFKDVPPAELMFQEVRRFTYIHDCDAPPRISFEQDCINANILAWEVECTSLRYRKWQLSTADLEAIWLGLYPER